MGLLVSPSFHAHGTPCWLRTGKEGRCGMAARADGCGGVSQGRAFPSVQPGWSLPKLQVLQPPQLPGSVHGVVCWAALCRAFGGVRKEKNTSSPCVCWAGPPLSSCRERPGASLRAGEVPAPGPWCQLTRLQCSEPCTRVSCSVEVLRRDALLSGDVPLGLSSLWQRGCSPLQRPEMSKHHRTPVREQHKGFSVLPSTEKDGKLRNCISQQTGRAE